jgi:regulator of protease activity HflC (stomatin/prohibitin superfamily)
MESNAKKIGLMNWIVLLGATLGLLVIARFVTSATGVMATVLTGFGLLVALLSFFHMGLFEREAFERMELEEISKARGSQSLFVTAAADTFPAKRAREQFERYIIPSFTGLLFLAQAFAAYWFWETLALMPGVATERAALAMALLGLFGLILFLLGKYSSGLARLQNQKLLRPGAAYLLLGAYACFTTTGAIAAVLAGFPKADLLIGRILCVICGLAATETLLALILEIYRVRMRGRDSRLLYESRLVGLLGQPEAIITTAAHALDYQFGFKVSETWFYRFLERALGWLLLAQFGALVLSTCFVIVQPGDQALLERFGRPLGNDGVIGPGLHLKLPWPIDRTTNYHTELVQGFIIGAEPERSQTIAWAATHAKETNFLVASRELNPEIQSNLTSEVKSPPVNLLSVSIPIQYQITNLANWAYINEDPETLLTSISEREVTRYLASADFDDLMSKGREAAAESLRINIQAQADQARLGAHVIFVGLEDIHPPVKVAKIFEQVVAAEETKESQILEAQAYAITTNAYARGESFKRIAAAEADRHAATTNSAARALLFASQQMAYNAAPGRNGVYEQRAYLEALVDGSRDARKYIIATTNTPNTFILNMQSSIRADLIDKLPAPTQK